VLGFRLGRERSGDGRAVIETKDCVLIGIALVGWGLALYLYVRNEWTKRPLVSVNFRRFKPKDMQCVSRAV
jgi:hypothetical protein